MTNCISEIEQNYFTCRNTFFEIYLLYKLLVTHNPSPPILPLTVLILLLTEPVSIDRKIIKILIMAQFIVHCSTIYAYTISIELMNNIMGGISESTTN